jgi:hypothetical protein
VIKLENISGGKIIVDSGRKHFGDGKIFNG